MDRKKKLNCFYSITANRRKQKDCFLWKNVHQSMSRNWENSSSMLQSPPKYLFSIEIEISATVLFSSLQPKVIKKADLRHEISNSPLFLCWFLGVVPFNTWLISSWANAQNDIYFTPKWSKLSFWVKIVVILSVVQLITTAIFLVSFYFSHLDIRHKVM